MRNIIKNCFYFKDDLLVPGLLSLDFFPVVNFTLARCFVGVPVFLDLATLYFELSFFELIIFDSPPIDTATDSTPIDFLLSFGLIFTDFKILRGLVICCIFFAR